MERTIHILNQFLWPDWAPTGIYAEQLAAEMQRRGNKVKLVGGKGSYRPSKRRFPEVAPIFLTHFKGRRESLFDGCKEFFSVNRAFGRYLQAEVKEGDIVVVTSAPPLTIILERIIRKNGGMSIYWLQDYYPELLKSIFPLAFLWKPFVNMFWNFNLKKWSHVVKISNNLGYEAPNSRVIRNWATMRFDRSKEPFPRTALYTGNLGHAHDVISFVRLCEELREEGYTIRVRGDGVGISRLPIWINVGPAFTNENDLEEACLAAEVLLIAAHPKIRRGLFPSKIWNVLAAGRAVRASGFSGEMMEELTVSLKTPPYEGLQLWSDWLDQLAKEKG